MSIERTYYCDGPDCGGDGGLKGGATSANATTATSPPWIPTGFIEVRETYPGGESAHHFCGWDCLMKYAAAQPIPTRIEWPADPTDQEGAS